MSVETTAEVGVDLPTMISSLQPGDVNRMSTDDLREHFLVENLMTPGEVKLLYSDLDRVIVGGAVPEGTLQMPASRQLGTKYFTERRELGIINLGEPGAVTVGGERFELDKLDCLYVGLEEPEISFDSTGSGPPRFYLMSCPAHKKYPTHKITQAEVTPLELGDGDHATNRRLFQYICPGKVESCQLVMGYTELQTGSVWNTMPAHLHPRRMEAYFYFDLDDNIVIHLMGSPQQTRHLVVRNEQAVLSPSWSIHGGAGTKNYRFVWGMAGENQDFTDMDALPLSGLR
jgi:4-deoxy-L-threo-5-hexosulose-uronate ketol-isomerase